MQNLLQWTAVFVAVSLVASSEARAQTAVSLASDARRGQTILVDAQGVRSISLDIGGRWTDGQAAGRPAGSAGSGKWRNIGPYGGSVTAIGLSPVDPDIILAGTDGFAEYGGLFRSTDAGETWARASVLGDEAISSVVFTPDGTAFAGARSAGLWQSTNGGLEWTFLDLTSPNWVSALAVHPIDGAEIWAGVRASAASLYRSEDGGASWQSVGPPVDPFEGCAGIAFNAGSPDNVYAACGSPGRVWVSTDGGASWTDRTVGLPSMNVFDVAHDGSRIFVGGSSGLYASSDDGLSWNALHDGIWPSFTTLAVAVDPGDPNVVYAGSDRSSGVHRSTDGGANWEIAIAGTEKLTVNAIEFAPEDPSRILLGANALGVFQSLDSGPGFRRTARE